MKKQTPGKKTSSTGYWRPALLDDTDDRMFKLTVMKKTLFFLVMASDQPKNESARLAPVLEEIAKELLSELPVEIDNCRAMREVLDTLTAKLGPARILELLDGAPADIERFRARERPKSEPSRGQ